MPPSPAGTALSTLPLVGARDLDAPLAWRAGVPLSARRFLADVHDQARQLPPHGPMINLCVDRYRFAVALGAALVRGHVSLLPPNTLADTLAGLTEPGALPPYGLTDDAELAAPGLELRHASAEADAAAHWPAASVPQIDAGQCAACLLTSGSTGASQAHARTWRALVLNIDAEARRLAELLDRPSLAGLNIVATVPAQHSYGFESSVLLGLLGGAAFDSGRPYFPADIAIALDRLPRPRALVTTPFHLKTLLLSGIALPTTDLVICATAPLSPQLAREAEESFGGTLVEIYGCTEAGQVATRQTVRSEVWRTFDPLRIERHSGDPDTAHAERFVVHGGHVEAPTALPDVLQLVDDRHFRLLGRANDLIHVAGKRSSLGYLDHQLNSIPGVIDGAFWLPDDIVDGVVRPVAFVVAPDLDARRLTAALRERLEAVFVPRRLIFLPSLPRADTGKLTAQSRRDLAMKHLSTPKPEAGA